jgi:LiaI-LiaF-like transmembrane region
VTEHPRPGDLRQEWRERRRQRRRSRRAAFGVLLVVLGVVFLLDTLGIAHLRADVLWPLVLIFFGVMVLFGAVGRGGGAGPYPGA